MTARRIRAALLLSTIASGFAAPALAQDAAAPTTADAEPAADIVVTGTRIEGAKTTEALPVVVLTEERLDATGSSSGDDLFRSIPQAGDVQFQEFAHHRQPQRRARRQRLDQPAQPRHGQHADPAQRTPDDRHPRNPDRELRAGADRQHQCAAGGLDPPHRSAARRRRRDLRLRRSRRRGQRGDRQPLHRRARVGPLRLGRRLQGIHSRSQGGVRDAHRAAISRFLAATSSAPRCSPASAPIRRARIIPPRSSARRGKAIPRSTIAPPVRRMADSWHSTPRVTGRGKAGYYRAYHRHRRRHRRFPCPAFDLSPHRLFEQRLQFEPVLAYRRHHRGNRSTAALRRKPRPHDPRRARPVHRIRRVQAAARQRSSCSASSTTTTPSSTGSANSPPRFRARSSPCRARTITIPSVRRRSAGCPTPTACRASPACLPTGSTSASPTTDRSTPGRALLP